MDSEKYQPHRHLSVEERAMAEMPTWINIVNEYMNRANGQYLEPKHQPDYGRQNTSR